MDIIRNFLECIGLRPAYVINLYKLFQDTSVAYQGTTKYTLNSIKKTKTRYSNQIKLHALNEEASP